jgi:hypothetical protein
MARACSVSSDQAVFVRSDRHDPKCRIESPKIIRIGRDDLLTSSPSADHNVSIHDVGRGTRSQEPSDVGGVNPIESYDVGRRLSKEPSQTRLPLRTADSLSESTCRHRDPRPGLASACQ